MVLGLIVALGACADSAPTLASTGSVAEGRAAVGPAGDYPVVLGEPFSVDGELYTPVDTMSYDEVGYAASDSIGGSGITAAHKTLPLPSYIEITSLVTGKTILARVERRGPMTGDRLVALSPGARAQLGNSDGGPVRVRRVNPPEVERAKLRMGQAASERMETPQSLVAVLKRKLPERGSATLGSPLVPNADTAKITAVKIEPSNASVTPEIQPVFESAFLREIATPTKVAPVTIIESEPEVAADTATVNAKPVTKPEPAVAAGKFVIQAATFSSQASADKIAVALGGFVQPAGKYFRVRVGPFSNRGQADAALAKVRAAGYSDARVSTAG